MSDPNTSPGSAGGPGSTALTPDQAANEPTAEAVSIEVLTEQLRQAELKGAELQDAYLRAKAEADNMRKRAQQEVANAHKYAVESFSTELLSVKDSLEAALQTQNASVESFKSGVELTLKQLASVFEKFGLKEVNPAGEKFDPHRHQAIGMVESEAAPNTVTSVLQKGYLLQERVLRPALVMVAKAKAESAPTNEASNS